MLNCIAEHATPTASKWVEFVAETAPIILSNIGLITLGVITIALLWEWITGNPK